jgi:hypothetical protein
MQKLVWKNSLGDEIDLTSGNYGITQWEGFSNASLNIQSQQVPFQDGGVYLDSLINQRELSVTLKMQDNGNLEERYRMRRELIHILNPKLGEGYLIYTNDFISKRIKCVAQIPLFETHNSDTRGTPKASLAWTACEPYWEDLEETVIDITTSANVNNAGDIPCQVKLDFITTDVTNPLIFNSTTKDKIQIMGKITEDVLINTNKGQKQVLLSEFENVCTNFKRQLKCICYNKELELYIGATDYMLFKSKDCRRWEYIPTFDYNTYTFIHGLVYNEETQNICVITGGTSAISSDTINWTYRPINVENFNGAVDVQYISSKKKIYALNENGYFITSSDGITWTKITLGDYFSCSAFVYVESTNTFVVVAYGCIIKSVNGGVWGSVSLTNASRINDIVYISTFQKYIVVGHNGKIYTSTNLTNWTEINSGTTIPLTSIDYSLRLNKCYIVGYDDHNTVILTSTNFDVWKKNEYSINLGTYCVHCIDEAFLVIIGNIAFEYYTEDGSIQDMPIINCSGLDNIIFCKNVYIGAFTGRSSGLFKSADAENWEQIYTGGVEFSINKLIYVDWLDSIYALVNEDSEIKMLVSKDLITWTNVAGFGGVDFISIPSKHQLVDLHTSSIRVSYDGVDWQTYNTGEGTNRKIIYSKEEDMYVIKRNNSGIKYSRDLINWSIALQNVSIDAISDWKYGIVVTSGTTLYYSFDCIIWNTITIPFRMDSLYYFEGLIYCIGNGGLVYKSYDLNTWTQVSIKILNGFTNISYSPEKRETYFSGEGLFIKKRTSDKNIINRLSADTNMNFSLKIGENNLLTDKTNGDFHIMLSYRQKYIGV